jgi:alpha-galactosidase
VGDSLATGAAFGGNVHRVLKQIRERNFEPAIWVAPFVTEESSHIFPNTLIGLSKTMTLSQSIPT